MTINRIIITVDGGVDYRTSTADKSPSMHMMHSAKLKSMKMGDSFFVPNILTGDLIGLIRFAQDHHRIFLNAHHFDRDAIYRETGSRVWRVEENEFVPPVQTDTVYYLHLNTGVTFAVPAETPQSPNPQVVRITQAEYLARPDYRGKSFVWADAEGATWWRNGSGEVVRKLGGQMLEGGPFERLDFAAYTAALFEQGKISGQRTYWVNSEGNCLVITGGTQYVEFEQSGDYSSYYEITRAEYEAQSNEPLDLTQVNPLPINDVVNLSMRKSAEELREMTDKIIAPPNDGIGDKAEPEVTETTYWRKVSGVVVEVAAAKYHLAKATKGAVEVTRTDYQAYIESLDEEL